MSISKVQFDGHDLINLENDTITADKMLSGYTAHNSSGNSVTGTIESQAAQTITPKVTSQSIAAGKYLSGAQTIGTIYEEVSSTGTMNSNLVAANVGKMYKFTGTSSSGYYNEGLYIVKALPTTWNKYNVNYYATVQSPGPGGVVKVADSRSHVYGQTTCIISTSEDLFENSYFAKGTISGTSGSYTISLEVTTMSVIKNATGSTQEEAANNFVINQPISYYQVVLANGSTVYMFYPMPSGGLTAGHQILLNDFGSSSYTYSDTQTQGTYIEQVTSADPNAYPDNGIQDGYWYVKQS